MSEESREDMGMGKFQKTRWRAARGLGGTEVTDGRCQRVVVTKLTHFSEE